MVPSIKDQIINDINNSLKNKVERVYIIGSFLNNNWNPYHSDIDLICIDDSFEYFPHIVNLANINRKLCNLNLKFDIFLYTWDQYYKKLEADSRFGKDIERAKILW